MKTKDFIIILLIIIISVFGYFKIYELEQHYNMVIISLNTEERLSNIEKTLFSENGGIVPFLNSQLNNNAQKQPQVVEPQTDEDKN